MSRRKRLVKRLLSNLNTVKPTGRPGPLIRELTRTHSKKDRKRKGHVEARMIKPQMKWSEVREEAIEPEKFWDDWVDARDSWRMNTATDQLYHKWNGSGPRKEEIYTQNNKLKKLIKIREAKLKHKKELISNEN